MCRRGDAVAPAQFFLRPPPVGIGATQCQALLEARQLQPRLLLLALVFDAAQRILLALQAAEQRMAQAERQIAAVVVIAHLLGHQLAVAAGARRGEPLPAGFSLALALQGLERRAFGLGRAQQRRAVGAIEQRRQWQYLGQTG